MPRQSVRKRALVAIGNRTKITSGELIAALCPEWEQRFGTMTRAGYWLSKALDAQAKREPIAPGPDGRERYRSFYYRSDLEAATGTTVPAKEEGPQARAVAPGTNVPRVGVPRCQACNAGKWDDDAPCWRCQPDETRAALT
jgi:hypothetical protein